MIPDNFKTISDLLKFFADNGIDIDSLIKVGFYMRYSSQNQNEQSIDYQRRKLLWFCALNRFYPVIEYIDEACSGRTEHRPDFQRMLRDSENNPSWEILLLFNLSRFCRSSWIGIKYFRELRERGIEITTVVENLPKTPEGRFMESLFHVFNEYSSDVNASHTHAAMVSRALKGNHCGGVPPIGYDIDKNTSKLMVNATEAIIVKKIFDMYEANYSYTDMANILNKDGHKTKAGKQFNRNSFDSILRQEKYTGTYTWNKSFRTTKDHKRNNRGEKAKDKQIVIKDGCPAIISKEQFERVQTMLGNRTRTLKGNRTKKHYMLSGLGVVKCAKCGSNMYATTKNSHKRLYAVYYCPNHKSKACDMKDIHAQSLHKFVASVLAKDIISRKDIHAILALVKDNSEYNVLKHKLQGKIKAISNTLIAIETESSDVLNAKLVQLTAEKDKIISRMNEIEGMYQNLNECDLNGIYTKLYNLLINSNALEVKTYIQEVIEAINIDDEDISITFKAL